MFSTPLRLTREAATEQLAARLTAIRGELELPEAFPDDVLAETRAAIAAYRLPDVDRTDIPLCTVDPEGSTDLDQALHLERRGDGFRVYYAIADVAAFVEPGGALDAEALARGQTLYAADGRIPLHPAELSEGAASLLPDVDRGAYLWEVDLDAAGAITGASVARARVRSRRQWTYDEAQDAADSDPLLDLLREVGELRLAREAERGGASLATPEALVIPDGDGYRLERRRLLPVEQWNAQLSLLTGMAAADLMLGSGVGVLRTMPPADDEAIARFRRQTRALGEPWPEGERYGDYLRRLSPTDPEHLAIRHAAAALFRGAAYRPFDGDPPEETVQAAIGAPYAHVTAPLRRLVDRHGLVVCAAISAGEPVPDWAREALPELPSSMGRSSSLAGRLDRMTLEAVEAAVLAPRVGAEFRGVALDDHTVQLHHPAVEAECDGDLEPGTDVTVRLVEADVATGTVRFTPA